MAKYRPVDVRLWSDRKFLSLSDRGKQLWLYLLTTPFALPIPGVIITGELAAAEQLGWSGEGFREGFQELLAKGLGVTRCERLYWLRNALRYQPIQGPNHIAAIAKSWDDVPDCALKLEIWQALKIACKGWSALFAKGVPEPFPDPVAEPLPNPFHTVSGSVTVTGSGDPPVVPPSGGPSDSPQLAAFKADVDAVTHPAADEPQREANAIAQTPTRRNRRARRTATEMPMGWHPRPEESAKARELGLDPAHEAEQFRDHHVARASTFADWDAAFRTWLRNARRFAGRTGRNQPTALELQLERVAMLEERERREASS